MFERYEIIYSYLIQKYQNRAYTYFTQLEDKVNRDYTHLKDMKLFT